MQPADRPPDLDLYAILGVSPRADADAIRAAWRAGVKASHPDVAHDPLADDRIREINLAWEWLGDPVRRRRYDLVRLARTSIARGVGAARRETGNPGERPDRPAAAEVETERPAGRIRTSRLVLFVAAAGLALAAVGVLGVIAVNPGGRPTAPAAAMSGGPRPTTFGLTPAPGDVGSAGSPSAGAALPEASATASGPPAAPTDGSTAGGPASTPAPEGATGTAGAASSPPVTAPATGRPLEMPVGDIPPECRTQAASALRLDGDVDLDGIPDSIFFVGPCPDLAGGAGAPDHVLGPYIYASASQAGVAPGAATSPGAAGVAPGAATSPGAAGASPGAATSPGWHLLAGAGPLAAGWAARSAFVGTVIRAPAGVTDLGVELVAPDGRTSTLAVYRVAGGVVRRAWDSLRDGHAWQDATFSFAPIPAGAPATDGARLLVISGPPDARVRQLWQWTTASGSLELRLVDSGPAPPSP